MKRIAFLSRMAATWALLSTGAGVESAEAQRAIAPRAPDHPEAQVADFVPQPAAVAYLPEVAPTKSPLRILMVAPQPFFRPRGTPFSVLHRIRALTAIGYRVDLLTYPFGDDVAMPGLSIRRCAGIPLVTDVKIGPSIAKLLLDAPLLLATRAALQHGGYDVVHSHEEAAFFCAPLARRFGALHVYDMHSSLPHQLANFSAFDVAPIRKLFSGLERGVLASADGVITICRDLADIASRQCGDRPHAMIENTGDDGECFDPAAAGIPSLPPAAGRRVVLYTGTLEPYQGIDLLLESFRTVRTVMPAAHLVLVGGRPVQVDGYRQLAARLGIGDAVTFTGQLPPSAIPGHLVAADVIVSPRSTGTNTPLKIYSYLRSGKPIVATNLYTHTQTLDPAVAELVDPTPQGLAAGLLRVLADPDHGRGLAEAARGLAEREYSDVAYLRKVEDFYRQVLSRKAGKAVA